MLCAGLLAAMASEAAVPRIAVHPLTVVEATPADAEELSTALLVDVAKQAVEMVASDEVKEGLAAQKKTSCVGDTSCLQVLARVTRAPYALWVSLAPTAPKWVVTARVVRQDGEVVRNIDAMLVDRPAKSKPIDSKLALKNAVAALKLGELPASPQMGKDELQVNAKPDAPVKVDDAGLLAVTSPSAAATQVAAEVPWSNLSLAGIGVAAAGAATGIAALVVALVSQREAADLAGRLDAQGRIRAEDVPKSQAIDARNTLLGVMYGVAGAAVLGGAAMTFFGRGEATSAPAPAPTPVSASVAPVIGGAALVVGGGLP